MTIKMNTLNQAFINPGPGESIKEELENLDWKQEDLAYILDISVKHLNEIINNKKSISLELAKLLGKVFNKTPQYWINLDTDYRLLINDSKEKEETVNKKVLISKYFPLNELFKKGWIERTKDINELEEKLKRFLNKNHLDYSNLEKELLPNFRKSESYNGFNPFFAHIWFQKAKNSASTISIPSFNQSALEDLYSKIHYYTVKKDGVSVFLEDLNATGVKFMVLSHLQKTYLDGAAFKHEENPVIAYTCRHNRIDNFWFTIAHEIAHVLRHLDDQEYFLDDIKAKNEKYSNGLEDSLLKKEEEANFLASQKLLENEILDFFEEHQNYITEDKVLEFSKTREIHPSIIVGMLAHNNILSYVNIHRFNDSIRDKIPSKYLIEKK